MSTGHPRSFPGAASWHGGDSKIRQIFRLAGDSVIAEKGFLLSDEQKSAIRNIQKCRTEECGFNMEICEECGARREHYNSCSDRNCPICNSLKREIWIDDRKGEVIDAPDYHAVFTCPSELRPLFLANRSLLFGLFHKCVGETIAELSRDRKYLGATPGIVQVLHTWNQRLEFHPHIHAIISGGGITENRKVVIWEKGAFFIAESVLSAKFRGKFLAEVQKLWVRNSIKFPSGMGNLTHPAEWAEYRDGLYNTKWVAHVKETFNGKGNAIEYLGRYANRVAISESRIVSVSDEAVTFTIRGEDGKQFRKVTVSPEKFVLLFLNHVLPKGFQKIRYYGFLNNSQKRNNLILIFNHQGYRKYVSRYRNMKKSQIILEKWGFDITCCPVCGSRSMITTIISRKRTSSTRAG